MQAYYVYALFFNVTSLNLVIFLICLQNEHFWVFCVVDDPSHVVALQNYLKLC